MLVRTAAPGLGSRWPLGIPSHCFILSCWEREGGGKMEGEGVGGRCSYSCGSPWLTKAQQGERASWVSVLWDPRPALPPPPRQ